MTTTVVRTKTPYTYETLQSEQLKSGSQQMQYDYYYWGYDKKVTVGDVENIEVTETETRKITKTASEILPYISDGDEVGTAITLYDVEFDNEVLTEDDFTDYVSGKVPLNYSPIRPLIPGEYEYQDAIVGVQMSIPPVEGRFGIIGSTLHVDVQDTVEKGTTTVTSTGPTTVNLSKTFYTQTKVLCNIVSATETAAVEVSQIGLTSFKVGLKSLTNPSNYVSGTIDWLVDGY